jgi:hypothetical protein
MYLMRDIEMSSLLSIYVQWGKYFEICPWYIHLSNFFSPMTFEENITRKTCTYVPFLSLTYKEKPTIIRLLSIVFITDSDLITLTHSGFFVYSLSQSFYNCTTFILYPCTFTNFTTKFVETDQLRDVGDSTQVPVRAWNNAPQVKLERRHMTYTVSMQRYTQSHRNSHQIKKLISLNV